MFARSNGTDIPDHPLLGVQVCSSDKQQPSVVIGFGNGGLEVRVQIAGDGFEQRRIICHSVAKQGGREDAGLQHVGRGKLGINRAQLRIVGRAKKSERRDERAGADAGHHRELRARPDRGPTAQQARAKCAVLAAARHCQEFTMRKHLSWRHLCKLPRAEP